jgi:signal transduction histidine kinase
MKVRFHTSLRTRFMFSVIGLLIVLVGSVIFVIEQREVKAIFEEQKNKGVLIAKNIANLNYYPFIYWDRNAVKENIEAQINKKLVYVIFYDRTSKPFVANDFIKDYEEIYNVSRLKADADEKAYFFESKKLRDKVSGKVLRILEIEVPIIVAGSPTKWGSIKIGLSLEEMLKEIQKTRMMLILVGLVGLAISVGGTALLSRGITGPLKKLVDATVKISKGEFTQQIDIDSKDEIGNLAQSFNDMSYQLLLTRKRMEEANKKLIQAEKLASIGRISAGIAHEIRNPLTAVKLNIQKLFQSGRLDEIEKEHLSLSQEGIVQMEKFIKDLLDFTRASELNLNRFSIEQILDESIKIVADSLELKKIVLEKDYEPGLPKVLVDGDKMRQVFLNVLRNAYETAEEGGRIKVSLSLLKDESGKKIKVEIADNGSGIPPEKREIIFEPFYTTKSSGIGLGLANARKIIEQHKGSIKVKDDFKPGACFEILIPCEGEK